MLTTTAPPPDCDREPAPYPADVLAAMTDVLAGMPAAEPPTAAELADLFRKLGSPDPFK